MEKEEEGIRSKKLLYCKSQEREFFTGFYVTIGGRRSTKNTSPIGVHCTLCTMLGQEEYKKILSHWGLLHFLYYAGALCSIHHGHNRANLKVSPCGDLWERPSSCLTQQWVVYLSHWGGETLRTKQIHFLLFPFPCFVLVLLEICKCSCLSWSVFMAIPVSFRGAACLGDSIHGTRKHLYLPKIHLFLQHVEHKWEKQPCTLLGEYSLRNGSWSLTDVVFFTALFLIKGLSKCRFCFALVSDHACGQWTHSVVFQGLLWSYPRVSTQTGLSAESSKAIVAAWGCVYWW